MKETDWTREFPGAITVTNAEGVILAMNAQSAIQFKDQGGLDLIGKNVLDCHPEPARSKLAELYRSQKTNVYTIQKHGRKRLIYQTPYYEDGKFAGLVELGLDIPDDLPHFNRD